MIVIGVGVGGGTRKCSNYYQLSVLSCPTFPCLCDPTIPNENESGHYAKIIKKCSSSR